MFTYRFAVNAAEADGLVHLPVRCRSAPAPPPAAGFAFDVHMIAPGGRGGAAGACCIYIIRDPFAVGALRCGPHE